jgi:hypothetical protein
VGACLRRGAARDFCPFVSAWLVYLKEFPEIAVSWSLGAIGAAVSIMSRLASDKFQLNYQAEHQSLRMLGHFRPLIGAILGSAVFLLITGGLLSLERSCDPDANVLFFFAGLAFLAGFTERLAHLEGLWGSKMRTYTGPSVLVIDELGDLPMDQGSAHWVFEVVTRRYERGSVVLTSNRGFAEWGHVFADPVVASAILDRLLHHATVINIKGKSYRLRGQEAALEDQEVSML